MNTHLKGLVKEISELDNMIDNLVNEISIRDTTEKIGVNNEKFIHIPNRLININIGYQLLVAFIKEKMLEDCNKIFYIIEKQEYLRLKEENLKRFLQIVYKYLEYLPEVTYENMIGVNKILDSIDKSVVNSSIDELYKNIFINWNYTNKINNHILLEYVISFFKTGYSSYTKEILNNILSYNYYRGFNERDIVDLTLMSLYFELDKEVQEVINRSTISRRNSVEYKLVKDLKNKQNTISNKYKNFEELNLDILNCDSEIAKKVFEKITNRQLDVYELYFNRFSGSCEFDKENLWMKSVRLPVYNEDYSKEIRKLSVSVLWCRKCNTYSLNKKMMKDVYRLLKPNEKISFINLGELNKISPLMILGYSTNVERQERTKLLKEIVIPTLGVEKVLNHIKFLIDINDKKTTKDLSRALSEWRYDIGMIKKDYNIG